MSTKKITPAEIKSMCICGGCPSYQDCTIVGRKTEKGFCIKGKSTCILEEKGCICHSCPVHRTLELKHDYYCSRNSEKIQEK